METTFFIGWVFLIASWIVPSFIKDQVIKRFTGAVLAALATGIFIGHLLDKL